MSSILSQWVKGSKLISKQNEGHKEMFLFQLFCKSQTEEIQQYLVYSTTAVPYTDFYHFLPLNNQ